MAAHWQCCCYDRPTDAEAIKYVGRMLLTVCVLAFSMIQIIRADACDGQLPFYTSLITFIVGMELNKMKKVGLIGSSDSDIEQDERAPRRSHITSDGSRAHDSNGRHAHSINVDVTNKHTPQHLAPPDANNSSLEQKIHSAVNDGKLSNITAYTPNNTPKLNSNTVSSHVTFRHTPSEPVSKVE